MLRCAIAGRRHIDLARIGFGIGDELRNGIGRDGRMHHHCIGCPHRTDDRCDISNKIEIQIAVLSAVENNEDLGWIVDEIKWYQGVK